MKKQSLLFVLSCICAMVIQAQVRITSTTPVVSTTPGATNVIVGSTSYSGTTPADNTFVGYNVGYNGTTGGANTFVGSLTGNRNTSGLANTFLGAWAGVSNTTGTTNTFVGQYCGYFTTTGGENTFVGQGNGTANTTGFANTFIGRSVGANTTGSNNTFLGRFSGNANTSGFNNLALGSNADFISGGLYNATAIGYNAKVADSNAMVLGGTGSDAVSVGIGVTSPRAHLHLFTQKPENVIFSTNNAGPSAASTLKLQTLTSFGGLQNGLDLSVSGPSMSSYILNSFSPTSVPALPRSNMGSVTTTSVPLMIGINGYENVSHNIHFINSIKNSGGSFIPTECMRINKDNGFVGIHSRTANSASGTGNPQALLHVNLTNITSTSAAGFNPLLNGIRFEGLPAANHPDVIVVDAQGNLATRPYAAGSGGSSAIPCDSVIKCAWGLQGNSISPMDYIGTNNADDFRFRTNNLQRGRVTVDGNWDFGSNTFSAAVNSSAMGSNNTIQFSNAALASGNNNRIGTNNPSDYATAIGYQNTIDASYAASAVGAKNEVRNNSLFASALGTINVLDNAEAAHTVGTGNTITNSLAAIALGSMNNIDRSEYALTAGQDNTIQGNSDKSGAVGNSNTITTSESSFAAGAGNKITGSRLSAIALGANNRISNSDESAIIGEDNEMVNGHGSIVGGGHNFSEGAYNILMGEQLHASPTPTTPPPTPLPDKPTGIMLIGDNINSTLTQSLSVGFNANRTVVINKRGLAIQMNPSSGSTFAPTHNLIVDADPAIGSTPVGSNIAFKNLPAAPYPMPMVLVDANGELYQSKSTAFRIGGSGKDVIADMKTQKNAQPITNALGLIDQIAPKQYTIDGTLYPTLELPTGKTSFGFVAQELEKVLPTLINEVPVDGNTMNGGTKETVKGINYTEMIPLLVQALKEQQAQINSQQNQINALLAKDNRSNDLGITEKNAWASINIQLSDADAILLQQNVPNPGDRYTAIGFHIPNTVKSASLIFTNITGQPIKTVPIAARGKGVFNLYTVGLTKGIYTYTLIADGKTVDTKKMIIER